jgi:hypothetical protein
MNAQSPMAEDRTKNGESRIFISNTGLKEKNQSDETIHRFIGACKNDKLGLNATVRT